jgi:hypothetical protein
MNVIFVAGLPRSGTTWVGQALGLTEASYFLTEPDNQVHDPFAAHAKTALGRYPVLASPDRAPAKFERLWATAFERQQPSAEIPRLLYVGRRRASRRIFRGVPRWKPSDPHPHRDPKPSLGLWLAGLVATPRRAPSGTDHVVVKSVLAALAVDWIWEHWQPQVVVVLRHPFNVVASWLELGIPLANLGSHPLVQERYLNVFGVPRPRDRASQLEHVAWEVGLLTCALEDAVSRHQEWRLVMHEELCVDPPVKLRHLAEDLGLHWTERADAYVRASDRPGSGYVTRRVSRDQSERWRTRLTREQVREIVAVLGKFPLKNQDLGTVRPTL